MSAKTCSLRVIKGGRRLSGTAAILHVISSNGGWDEWLEEFSKDVAKRCVHELHRSQLRPKLRVVR